MSLVIEVMATSGDLKAMHSGVGKQARQSWLGEHKR